MVIRRVFNSIRRPHHPPYHLPIHVHPQINSLLEKPTWSVTTLLSPVYTTPTTPDTASDTAQPTPATPPTSVPSDSDPNSDTITTAQLHHLLRLSALPPPASPAEEASLLTSLRQHMHFVRAMRAVDTTATTPLVCLRDDTAAAAAETTVTEEAMEAFFALEESVGRNGRVRRRPDAIEPRMVQMGSPGEKSDVRARSEARLRTEEVFGMKGAQHRSGRERVGDYFVVKKRGDGGGRVKCGQKTD